ncbi:fibrous sheath-interacting protein 1 isoform X2 [Silurus meridionalis]|uniref:fibrous sheath-interacting protein 1 isoform X2 n=1 Tax=Silurus meridionalis TaxID=175797 RepID=UPI001EEB2B90|nr:fibrous sheath-interacting protein 1 isoform X2 [Silurus meridionalis]
MDITKGSLDDISRPASTERCRPGSRVSTVVLSEGVKLNQDRTGFLEVLSAEILDVQDPPNIEEDNLDCPSLSFGPDQDVFGLERAIMKLKRLDAILASKLFNEKEVKKQGRELHQKLWKEFKDHKHESSSECTDEAENTRMFLALTPNTSKDCSEMVDYVAVFGTQVPDQELSCKPGNKVFGSEVRGNGKSSSSVKVGPEIKDVKQTESRQSVIDKSKHRQDFIKKNIELASNAGSLWPMTQEEKERLEELLKDIDGEEINLDPTVKPEADVSMCFVSGTPGEGYTPDAAELEKLLQIDAKLQLLPVRGFLSVQSSYGYCFSQDKNAGELGERVLQDMKELREQKVVLCEIQQQLQLHTERQHPYGSPQRTIRMFDLARFYAGCPS